MRRSVVSELGRTRASRAEWGEYSTRSIADAEFQFKARQPPTDMGVVGSRHQTVQSMQAG
jgi:hypothetical protein